MKGYSKDVVKISYDGEPLFYINERKRTVTCVLRGTLRGPEYYNGNFIDWDGVSFNDKRISATETARCHKDDAFDVERGKRIALSKAENALYTKATLEVSKTIEQLDFIRDACDKFVIKAFNCQAHNFDYIDSLTMPAHPKYNDGPLSPKKGVEVSHIKA